MKMPERPAGSSQAMGAALGPDTGGIPSNIHRHSRTSAVLIRSRVRQILEGNAVPTIEEQQKARRTTE